jgi:hypothetical protein
LAIYNKLKGNGGNMPQIEGVADSPGDLTATQYALLTAWKNGTFVNDWPPPAASTTITPDGLDRAGLENCVGAAFYPGIEAGGYPKSQAPFRNPNNFSEPFRLDHTLIFAGDVTSRMALPWQADFNACGTNWWPVPRPNEVLPQGGGGYQAWDRNIGSSQNMVAFWHTQGFVVGQGAQQVEVDLCSAPSITLVTPSLDFGDVPQKPMGAANTQALAATFEVQSTTSQVTLQFTGAPTHASFTNVSGPQVIGPTGAATVVVRLWVKYTTGAVNSTAAGAVTVQHAESGLTWTISLTARTVARQAAAVALVLDRSGSMNEDRGDGTSKIQTLREATKIFVELMQQGDGVSVVRYNENAQALRAVTVLGDPLDPFDLARADIISVLSGSDLNPGGSTSIGDGIHEGRNTLTSAAAFPVKSLVVLTDGKENQPQYIADVAAEINELTYAVGLGTAANTSAAALQTISGNNGGYLLITGAITLDNRFLLQKYFIQILAGITNAEVVLDPDGMLVPNVPQVIPVRVTDQDAVIEVILLTPNPKAVSFWLRAPTGALIDPNTAATRPGIQYVEGSGVSFYRIALPVEVIPQRLDRAGTWEVLLGLGRAPISGGREGAAAHIAATERPQTASRASTGRGLPYSVIVHAYSTISLRARMAQSSFEPGAQVRLSATLTETGIPVETGASVWAEVRTPGGTTHSLPLQQTAAGIYEGTFSATDTGIYRARVRATGASSLGYPFQREQTLTAAVWIGGGQPGLGASPANDPFRRLCAFLSCVLTGGALAPELEDRLRRLGLDPQRLRKCLTSLCPQGTLPENERPDRGAHVADAMPTHAALRTALLALQQHLAESGDA